MADIHDTQINEVWKPIPGHIKYEVSNMGRVRSIRKGIVMKASLTNRGYPMLALGRGPRFYIHRLVMLAFIGPCPEGYEVNHKDYNRQNPKLENLEYVTGKQNRDYSHANIVASRARGDRSGPRTRPEAFPIGEQKWNAKLNPEKVKMIRLLREEHKITLKQLASQFGVDNKVIRNVCNRVTWKHVP